MCAMIYRSNHSCSIGPVTRDIKHYIPQFTDPITHDLETTTHDLHDL